MCFITPFIYASFIYAFTRVYSSSQCCEKRYQNKINLLYYNLHVEYTESVYASYTPHNIQYMPFINYVNMLLISLISHIQSVCAGYFCYSLYIL